MKFEDIHTLMQKPDVKPDTYEAGMALNQLLKIGTHAIKIHNMIDDDAEMEAWVAKKIDLASNYVKSVHGYTAGSKAGAYDDDGMSEDASGWKLVSKAKDIAKKMAGNLTGAVRQIEKLQKDLSKNSSVKQALAQFNEDAGEGHMSKSQLYQTAKMAIELLDMINKGDDLEGWVQTKLNLAADYLQAVYHYEDYQKLNPYREELDSALIQRHAGIIQKHLDEILERECRAEDVDTKPGMMKILKKRVNEIEKEIAKLQRKNTDEVAPPGREKQVKKLKGKFKDKGAPYAIAWAQHNKHGKPKKEAEMNEDPRAVGRALANIKYAKAMANAIMKGEDMMLLRPKAQAFLSSADETIELLDKMYAGPTNEEAHLEEGIKEWAKRLAMAGVIVAGMAGISSINDAIDNSIPAIKAMNNALEMAQEKGDDQLAKMIEKDISAAKVRLDSGKDLSYVKDLQDKYAKFITTEGLNFESRLAVRLEQRIK